MVVQLLKKTKINGKQFEKGARLELDRELGPKLVKEKKAIELVAGKVVNVEETMFPTTDEKSDDI